MVVEMVLEQVENLAKKLHEGQMRKFTGIPYYTHPKKVSILLEQYFGKKMNPRERIVYISAALLHDTVEDCGITLEDLKNYLRDFENTAGYDTLSEELIDRIVAVVDKLTTSTKCAKRNKTQYLIRTMNNLYTEDFLCFAVKMCDRIDNAVDLVYAEESFAKSYAKETATIFYNLDHCPKELGSEYDMVIARCRTFFKGGVKWYD